MKTLRNVVLSLGLLAFAAGQASAGVITCGVAPPDDPAAATATASAPSSTQETATADEPPAEHCPCEDEDDTEGLYDGAVSALFAALAGIL